VNTAASGRRVHSPIVFNECDERTEFVVFNERNEFVVLNERNEFVVLNERNEFVVFNERNEFSDRRYERGGLCSKI